MVEQNYSKLLKSKRFRNSTRGPLSILAEAESDRARVLYSSAFRRLQRKTQVFPLEENAAVRSRLTHSLEVAHVGRYIATSIVEEMRNTGVDSEFCLTEECGLALPSVIETACLLHDIGNPPFGHFGEAAISSWARSVVSNYLDRRAGAGAARLGDFTGFDGNPQGLRIITHLAGVDQFGMNLTLAQIGSTVKYPCYSDEIDADIPSRKKAGIFCSEGSEWEQVRTHFGLGRFQRFPLALIMEAADDISYCLSDIEDGIEKGYTNHDLFYDHVRSYMVESNCDTGFLDDVLRRAKEEAHIVEQTVAVRAKLVRELVKQAALAYVKNHEAIFAGKVSELLDKRSSPYLLLKAIRATVENQLYGRPASVKLELAGYTALQGILRKLECLSSLNQEEFLSLEGKKVPYHLVEAQRLFTLLPPKYLSAYKRAQADHGHGEERDRYCRIQLMIDFVAGMTDVFALSTYQMLHGIK